MLRKSISSISLFAIFLTICISGIVLGRAEFDPQPGLNINPAFRPAVENPNTQYEYHNIGKLGMTITNYGMFGIGDDGFLCDGEPCPNAEFPINSDLEYLYSGSLWIGAIIGRDTLVSVGGDGWVRGIQELLPDPGPSGAIIARSNLPSRNEYSEDAISEQDFICTFTDSNIRMAGVDPIENRPHIPLNIAVKQSSYAWSYDYAEDFILFDYQIKNIGIFPLRELYIALYIDADVAHLSEQAGHTDDICGFRRTVKMPPGFGFEEDTVNIAWIGDNDGNPIRSAGNLVWDFRSLKAATGVRVVRSPNPDLSYSFNWWISNGDATLDFGPRMAGTDDDPFRDFGGGGHLGTPTGDRNKYYVMSHPEFDYDQLYSAINHSDEGYRSPPRPSQAIDFSDGYDTRYLLSFGPFDVSPGDSLPVTIAYLAGDEVHQAPGNFAQYFDAYNPDAFYNTLGFDDFGKNARWASWVYDNPGYDTDGDGDSGRYNWSCQGTDSVLYFKEFEMPPDTLLPDCKKVYYAGDTIPDFRGAAPPPPPDIYVMAGSGEVTIRWNGQRSENSIDVFSGKKDFEGYRVYYSLSDQASDFILITSFDVDDYKRFEYNTILQSWEQTVVPFTRDSLKSMYGPYFEPLDYPDEANYFIDPHTNEYVFFRAQDWNQSDLSNPNLIHRVYPNASKYDPTDTTDEGFMRYYEYEYVIKNLQPSIPYHFSVTAFDYGSLKVDLGALESSPLINAVEDYPLPSSDEVEENSLKVKVFPNPYRIDGGYAASGYENRDRTRSAERTRVINFTNLPKVCTIRIYSIDGDLIKKIDHYYPDGGPGTQHETWDVISRNTQAVVTGIYVWHVTSEMGDQLGKLVIMK